MFHVDFARSAATPVVPANCAAMRVGSGILAATQIETQTGWQPAETLRLGDRVYTVDGGLAAVLGLDRQWITPQAQVDLVHVPGGVIDNTSDLHLLSDQHVLIDTLGDAMLPDVALVLIPATALVGWRGIRRVALTHPLEVITPWFAAEEIVYANAGTMLHCPGIMQREPGALASDFNRLDLRQAAALLARLNGDPSEGADLRRVA